MGKRPWARAAGRPPVQRFQGAGVGAVGARGNGKARILGTWEGNGEVPHSSDQVLLQAAEMGRYLPRAGERHEKQWGEANWGVIAGTPMSLGQA